ncbi:hypothetical protein L210DRAFT_3185402 [Boletus edulis BED1]|uniref:Uncharacterized protein n=1 Tax=Boletus edulis BED1 TaxID=1328754 RepID=A0AAD4BFA1_BOLED|nr:hypothetical protein L210DRAFT_3185402 [Boletus edulis BED1]
MGSMGHHEMASGESTSSMPKSITSKDIRTPEEHAGVFRWTQKVNTLYPYRTLAHPCQTIPALTLALPQADVSTSVSRHGIEPSVHSGGHSMPLPTSSLEADMNSTSNYQLSARSSWTTCETSSLPLPLQATGASRPFPKMPAQPVDRVQPCVDPVLPSKQLCKISFAHGIQGHKNLTFAEDEVGQLPMFRFAGGMQGIKDINIRWDDDPQHWRGNSYIHLHGLPIPMVYWRDIYAGRFPKMWSSMKSQWSKYKIVIDCYRQSPVDFEARFAPSGALMPIDDITKCIHNEKAGADKAWARESLGDDIHAMSTYRKESKQITRLRMAGTVLPQCSPPPTIPLPEVPE